ncbi:MAG: hypothetical protein HOV92_12620 [Streptomyces sp.]|nr:hypothetical protein [Streptomyces sp.]
MTTPTPAYKVGDRVQLTVDIHSIHTDHKKGDQGRIRSFGPCGHLLTLLMDDGRTQFAYDHETTPANRPATTGPDFARAHGNDSSTWTAADIECEQILAALDLHRACPRPTLTRRDDHATAA